ncbi:MAG: multiheme c-type cytochrome [Fuerstiella sp.]
MGDSPRIRRVAAVLTLCVMIASPGCTPDQESPSDSTSEVGQRSADGATTPHGDAASGEANAADAAAGTEAGEAPASGATAAEPGAGEHGAAQQPAAAAERKQPVWESWPQPALALMLTSEMHGFFEPCGCTSNQLGGMSRRADLRKKLTDAGWVVRGLDVGGLPRRSTRQAQIKFETTLAALRDLQYVAIGLGPEELRLQPDFLLSQHIVDGDSPLFFLSANLQFFGIPDLGTPLPATVFEAAGLKIGVTSVMSRQYQAEVLPHPDVAWSEPGPALKKVLADFDEQAVDLRVLLSQGAQDESRALAEEFPEFEVILTSGGPGDPDPKAAPEKVGRTLLIEAGRKGKYVGVLGFYPEAAEDRFRFQLVSLERDDFDDTPAMVALMETYQSRLKDEQIVLEDGVGSPHPSGATFVGADTCGQCHTTAFDIWKNTPHAHALESLDPVHKRLGYERLNGVPRMYDPECLACHVTGWDPHEYIRFESGFLNEEFAASESEKQLHRLLAGTQCENCHGPGSRHVELVEADQLAEARQQVRVTKEQAEKQMCGKCHDADNSPNFSFDEYWKKVEHYGLD